MQVEIRTFSTHPARVHRTYVRRRLRFKCDSYPGTIRRLKVRLIEQDAAKAGQKKVCQITAHLIPSGTIRVRQTGTNTYRAIDKAVERFGSAIRRGLERRRGARRGFESIRRLGILKKVRGKVDRQ
jgi:ribosome-associated translation inhibitor RaiA